MILGMPWIVMALVAYNVIVFLFGAPPPADPTAVFDTELFTIKIISGGLWTFTMGDLVLILALFALFIEIIKATQTRNLAILDHGLSMLVFIVCLIEFLIIPEAATSLFFAVMLIALIDVVAGFYVGLTAARRDVTLGGGL